MYVFYLLQPKTRCYIIIFSLTVAGNAGLVPLVSYVEDNNLGYYNRVHYPFRFQVPDAGDADNQNGARPYAGYAKADGADATKAAS